MIELVTRNYWWPEVTRNLGRYVDGFNLYQRIKNRTEALVGNLIMNEVLEKVQTHLMVDFITKLLLVVGKNAFLIVCDQLSKIAYFVTITEEISVERLARFFRNNV